MLLTVTLSIGGVIVVITVVVSKICNSIKALNRALFLFRIPLNKTPKGK